MKNKVLVLMFIGFMVSCSKDNNTNNSFEINGKFTHQIKDCYSENPEINCVEFVDFINDSIVDALIGGGDIVFRTNYQIKENKIILEQTDGLNLNITFSIQDETTLNRIEDGEVWKKE